MSYDLDAYLHGSRLPTIEALVARLATGVPAVSFPEGIDLADPDGFVPTLLGVTRTGFELIRSAITEAHRREHEAELVAAGEPPDDYLAMLRACDTQFMFGCHDDDEIEAARLVALALAELSGGYLGDPQTGELRAFAAVSTEGERLE